MASSLSAMTAMKKTKTKGGTATNVDSRQRISASIPYTRQQRNTRGCWEWRLGCQVVLTSHNYLFCSTSPQSTDAAHDFPSFPFDILTKIVALFTSTERWTRRMMLSPCTELDNPVSSNVSQAVYMQHLIGVGQQPCVDEGILVRPLSDFWEIE
ncbi:hypothetical protein Q3G72_017826 [Acer saccharum]|nr:hypothetical protein Q3G72_017826 [Acer saccharum]